MIKVGTVSISKFGSDSPANEIAHVFSRHVPHHRPPLHSSATLTTAFANIKQYLV